MKKSILAICGFAALLVGCSKVNDVREESPRHLTVDITVNYENPETKAVKTGWESGDKVYVVFDDHFGDDSEVLYLTMAYDGSSWESSFSSPSLEAYLLEKKSGTLSAAYWSDLEPEFRYSEPELQVTNGKYAPGIKMMADNFEWSISDDNILTSTMTLKPFDYAVHFSIEGVLEEEANHFTFENEYIFGLDIIDFVYSQYGTVGGFESPVEEGIKAGYYNGIIFYGGLDSGVVGQSAEYVIKVTDNRGTTEKIDDIVYTLTKTATLKYKDAIKLPSLDSGRWTVKVTPNINGHEYVEMGNGLKWATMNLGANEPEEYGVYYAWGETTTKEFYLSSNYTYSGSSTQKIDASNDAASVSWGASWRIPTEEEWKWLRTNCNWTWTTENGVKGYSVKTKSGDNRIFLPAAGYHVDGDYYDNGSGAYWASTSYNEELVPSNASAFLMTSDQPYLADFERYAGLSIRPVSSEQ